MAIAKVESNDNSQGGGASKELALSMVSNDSAVAGATAADALDAVAASAAFPPLSGILWVDQASLAATPDGTVARPYPTIAAALAFIATQTGVPDTAWNLELAANQIYAENVALPDDCFLRINGQDGTVIDGTVDWAASAGYQLQLANLRVTGQVDFNEGAAPGAVLVSIFNCRFDALMRDTGTTEATLVVQGLSAPNNLTPWLATGVAAQTVFSTVNISGDLYSTFAIHGAVSAREQYYFGCVVNGALDSPGTRVYAQGTIFRVSTMVFTGAAGQIWLDTSSNFWWKANAITLTNGTKVIKSDAV